MEITKFHSPDSIWTWKYASRQHKVSLWLPYFNKVEKLPKGQGDKYTFFYKGGDITLHLKDLDFIMFYGASGFLPIDFLDKLNSCKIPLMIHRRNMPTPYLFFPERKSDEKDVLTAQILTRENQIKACYVARILIRERFRCFEKFFNFSPYLYKLKKARSLDEIRNIEAILTNAYWKRWFSDLGINDISRRQSEPHPINETLDAGFAFFQGIILRWVLFHKMSPSHGFLHEPSTYAALIFDLIEPYRYIIEDVISSLVKELPKESWEEKLTAYMFVRIKEKFNEVVYVPQTRQEVKRKNLLHGIVLSLRSYLLGETKRFVVPTEGNKKGGRPLKLNFRLPGK